MLYSQPIIDILRNLDLDPKYLNEENLIDFLDSFKDKQQRYYVDILKREEERILIIKNLIKDEGLPEEFLYLAMVESEFNHKSRSSAKAIGPWQIMEKTAKNFKLKIDKQVDERRDIIKSTKAAAAYLHYLYNFFGKWYLAILAYNCGEGRLQRAIIEAGTDNIWELLRADNEYLPQETRQFLRKILIIASLCEDEDFLIENASFLLNQGEPLELEKIKLKAKSSLKDIAKKYDLDFSYFKLLNPQFKSDIAPNYSYYAYVPKDKIKDEKDIFFAQIKDTAKDIKPKKILSDEDRLKRLGLKNAKEIRAQKLEALKDKKAGIVRSYTVKQGDTLLAIAIKHKTSVKKLKQLNKLKNDKLKLKQKLKLH